jgi:DNA modification methylase
MIHQGDALTVLRTLPDESVQCCITSPPYWGLRDYGTASWEGGDAGCQHTQRMARQDYVRETPGGRGGSFAETPIGYREACGKCGARRIDQQLGLESTPEEYVGKMVEVFREVRRVLRKDGTLWLNLGDSYAGSGKGPGSDGSKQRTNTGSLIPGQRNPGQFSSGQAPTEWLPVPRGLKEKDLCGIPWRVAFALQADGWYLRSDIIWAKPNPMPESVTDRPTKAHEYIFLLTRSPRYFFDQEAVREAAIYEGDERHLRGDLSRLDGNPREDGGSRFRTGNPTAGRNIRSIWTIATQPFPEAHFATFPEELASRCIKAGTSEKGCCAECGTPWERVVERTTESDPSAKGSRFDKGKTSGRDGGDRTQPGERFVRKLRGWRPGCDHDAERDRCTVLDPFAGSGTVGAVCARLQREFVGIELNPEYIEIANRRIAKAEAVAEDSRRQQDLFGSVAP